jgi:hypothetical protein
MISHEVESLNALLSCTFYVDWLCLYLYACSKRPQIVRFIVNPDSMCNA